MKTKLGTLTKAIITIRVTMVIMLLTINRKVKLKYIK